MVRNQSPGKCVFPGLAKDAPYPGSRCTPPWAKLSESPDRFFSPDDVPELNYDDGLRKVTLQDPSRMKVHELNACLRLWQDRQLENKPSFQFHHWWSEGLKEYILAHEPKPLDSGEENDDDPAENHKPRNKGKGKKKKTEDVKKGGKTGKLKEIAKAEGRKEKKSNRRKPQMGGKVTIDPAKPMNQDSNIQPLNDVPAEPAFVTNPSSSINFGPLNPEAVVEHMTPKVLFDVDLTFASLMDMNHQLPPTQPIERNPDHDMNIPNIVKLPVTSIPIDPALTGFPTHGPNDHVPQGYHAIPSCMLPSFGSAHNMPGPSTNFSDTRSSVPLPPIPPLMMSTQPNSGEFLTLERLAQMMTSLEARLTLQESKKTDVTEGSQPAPADTHEPMMEEEESKGESRPKTWPNRATPLQTRRKTTEIAGDSKLRIETNKGNE